MRRDVTITIILFVFAAAVTVLYFKNLHLPGQQSGKVMNAIPADAALVFEYKNDQDFYDLFNNNKLLTSLCGDEKSVQLNNLRVNLLQNPVLKPLFAGQSIFISVHVQKDSLGLLITTSASKTVEGELDAFAKQPNSDLIISSTTFGGKPGLTIKFNKNKQELYLVNQSDDILSVSFSRELVEAAARYRDQKHADVFVQMTEQQDANSIANLYVNYLQLTPLFDAVFKNKNNDLFRSFRELPAVASLNLNYKADALMFNGISHINSGTDPNSYLSLFRYQLPTTNKLKDIFPATTAYSVNFAVSDPIKFENNLFQWQVQTGVNTEKTAVFNRIKRETAVDLTKEFTNVLGNEFAIITTKYQEKIAIIQLKNGAQLRPFMVNISTMANGDAGQLNYDKLPMFLLGDAFGIFRRPYFTIVDNYLVFCGSQTGLMEYARNYTNGKFLSNDADYRNFDNLQAEKSNVSFFIQFKNSLELLKAELEPDYTDAFANKNERWNNYYGAAYQFTAADKDFFTNFYMGLNVPDSTKTTP